MSQLTLNDFVQKEPTTLEEQIMADAKRIADFLGIAVPHIDISKRLSNAFTRWNNSRERKVDYIRFGIKDGYHRRYLVHEMIHATGAEHGEYEGLPFRSLVSADYYTPYIESKIFGIDEAFITEEKRLSKYRKHNKMFYLYKTIPRTQYVRQVVGSDQK